MNNVLSTAEFLTTIRLIAVLRCSRDSCLINHRANVLQNMQYLLPRSNTTINFVFTLNIRQRI